MTKQAIHKSNLKTNSDGWMVRAPGEFERLEAFFNGVAYAPHRHDTYAIGLTISVVLTVLMLGNDYPIWYLILSYCYQWPSAIAGGCLANKK